MNNSISSTQQLPQYPESLWRSSTELPTFPRLTENITVDVAIVGAGIAGITTAYLLSKEGFKVAVLDAGQILQGTTGHTTAKVTAQHGMIYDELIQNLGEAQASKYYQANNDALQWIAQTVKEHNIPCEWQQQDAYLYAESNQAEAKLMKEFKAYEKLGIPGQWKESVPVPLHVKGAIQLPGQAQFHPLAYLKALVDAIVKAGGVIYENTTVSNRLEGERPFTLTTLHGDHHITCQHLVSTSHFPFSDGGGFFFSRLHAERSYVIAMKPQTPFAEGMYISVDEPTRSLRTASWNGEQLVLVGGESHKTGQGICTYRHYENLEEFGAKLLGNQGIPFRWSTQDLVTLDKVPYIGQITSKDEGIYVATGFAKWGMTTSAVAARIITDQIQGRDNLYSDLFSPSRFNADPSIKNFVVQNANVAKEMLTGKLGIVYTKADELEKDEGSVITHYGKRAGAYRDPEGNLHLVDTTCTHMGCEVEWNEGERTWDCPCHGSRFGYDGKVMEGPAQEALKRLDYDKV
ncbi:FAD-dependent oxidoreductase [Paenibacillus sp. FA6]|uniref:FAD-dependent oxidoreductase n=1 Tax=Paenibacillus sp. FA6 TaxID=3413029 RepID=UPI003F65EB6E